MIINMVLTVLVVFLLSISTVFGQTHPNDLKLKGLNGPVKLIISTDKAISGYAEWVLKDETKYQTTYNFDRDGNLTESLSEGQSTSKYIYLRIDGNRAFKTIEVKPSPNTLRTTISTDPTPIEANEKLTKPDLRYDFKYVYEIADNGHEITERQIGNDGKVFRKRIFVYSKEGVLQNVTQEDTNATMKYSYKYNSAGILIEENETRDLKVAGTNSKSSTVYSEIEFDDYGNWTKRKVTKKTKVDAWPIYNLPETEYTLVSIQSRSITYHQQ